MSCKKLKESIKSGKECKKGDKACNPKKDKVMPIMPEDGCKKKGGAKKEAAPKVAKVAVPAVPVKGGKVSVKDRMAALRAMKKKK